MSTEQMIAINTYATMAAILTAIAALLNVQGQSRLRELEMRPGFGWTGRQFNQQGNELSLFFLNSAKDSALVMVLDIGYDDTVPTISGNLGAPISIGPGAKFYIALKSPSSLWPQFLRISLYYWDVGNQCHRSKVFLEVGNSRDVFVRSDRAVCLGQVVCPPEVMAWPAGGRDYFYRPWWAEPCLPGYPCVPLPNLAVREWMTTDPHNPERRGENVKYWTLGHESLLPKWGWTSTCKTLKSPGGIDQRALEGVCVFASSCGLEGLD